MARPLVGVTVRVVEDDAELLDSLTGWLLSAGAKVHGATDAMDGSIRRDLPFEVPAIALTGSANGEDVPARSAPVS